MSFVSFVFIFTPLSLALMKLLVLSALLYLVTRPYPDNLQNLLLGLADIATALGILFMSILHFVTVDGGYGDVDGYLEGKWVLGWLCVIMFIVAIFLLLVELTVSIVRGNSSPQNLTA